MKIPPTGQITKTTLALSMAAAGATGFVGGCTYTRHQNAKKIQKKAEVPTPLPPLLSHIKPAVRDITRDIPKDAQRPLSALGPAFLATGLFYPFNTLATLVQKEGSTIPAAYKKVTQNGTNPLNLFSGASSVLRNAVLQRSAQYLALGTVKDTLKTHTSFSNTTINFLGGCAASFVDTLIMGPAEIQSISRQLAAASSGQYTPQDIAKTFNKQRGFIAIATRDFISNAFGFTLPQELRQHWDLGDGTAQKIITTFGSLLTANLITTPIDGIKTAVLTDKELGFMDAFKKLLSENTLYKGYLLRASRQAGIFSLTFVGAEYVYENAFKQSKSA